MPRYSMYDNPLNYSFSPGRVFGIRIRIHLLFILWVLFEILRHTGDGLVAFAAVVAFTFFFVVLLHEFGHCFGARALGGDADDILMWPLGGLASVHAPNTPRAQFLTTAAGPAVNVLMCLFCGLVLLLSVNAHIPWNPLNPFMGIPASVGAWHFSDWIVVLWGVNYIILLFNLLPVFPMDGGRMMQAVLWKYKGQHKATLIATFVGMVGAIALGLAGMIFDQIILVCIAVFGYLTCMQQRQMTHSQIAEGAEPWSFGGSPGYAPAEPAEQKRSSWLSKRRQARLIKKVQKERQRQLELERQIDTILKKVHEHGLSSLSSREKKILNQASLQEKERSNL